MCDRYAVAVLKDKVIIEHLPKKISKVHSLFFKKGGSITQHTYWEQVPFYRPTTRRARDPMLFAFTADMKEIDKLEKGDGRNT